MEDRRHVKVQVLDLGSHGLDEQRRLKAETVQDQPCLVAAMAQAGCYILPFSQGTAQSGVGHGGDHGIRIRVPVPGDIDLFHRDHTPLYFSLV